MMNRKMSILIAILLILSAFFVCLNLGSTADAPPEELGVRGPPFGYEHFWEDIELPSEPVFDLNFNGQVSEQAEVAMDNQFIYVVWSDSNNTNGANFDLDIFFRYFDGNSWSDIEVISEPVAGQNYDVSASYKPDIAVENGNIYIVWHSQNITDNSGSDYDIFYRCNMGTGWSDIQVISEPEFGSNSNTGTSYNPHVEVYKGRVYVTWEDYTDYQNSGSDADIFYRYFNGVNWEPIEVISEPTYNNNLNWGDSFSPQIDVEEGRIYVLWYDYTNYNNAGYDYDIFLRFNLLKPEWEDIQVISEPVFGDDQNTQSSYDGDLTVDNGIVYAVWEDSQNYNGAGWDRDIFYRKSIDVVNAEWEDIQVISEPVEGMDYDTGSENDPRIETEYGNVYAVWNNDNDTDGSGTDHDIFFRHCFSGLDWQPIKVISELDFGNNNNTGDSIYPDIDVENGLVCVVWQDNNNTNNSGTDYDIQLRKTFIGPTLSNPGVSPTIGNSSTSFDFTVTYTDIYNHAPAEIQVKINHTDYDMIAVNPGDTNYTNGKDYSVTLTHLDIGTFDFRFQANNGKFGSYLMVYGKPKVVNTPPEITTNNDNTAPEDVLYEVDYEYYDMDYNNVGQKGKWSVQTTATWLSIDPDTGVLSGTPTKNHLGAVWVNVTIDDGWDIDWTKFQLTVTPVNDGPNIGTDQLPDAIEDEVYYQVIDISDEETPIAGLDFAITTNADWLTVNKATQSVNGTPLNEHVGGDFWIKVDVEDGTLSTHKEYTFTVLNTNDAPEIIGNDTIIATVGKYYINIYEAVDIDPTNDTLKWSVMGNAGTWLDIDKDGGWLHGTPGEHNIGKFWVDVIVSDGIDSTTRTFNLTIKAERSPNQPPMIITADITIADVNVSYSVLYEAVDDRTSPSQLTWTMKTDGTWLNFNATSALLSGKPAIGDIGTWWVNITVMDTENGSDYHYFLITIEEPYTPPPPPPQNNKPELTNGKIEPDSGPEGTTFTFTVHYSDEDDDPAEFVTVVIDGVEHKMERTSGDATEGDYRYTTTLPEGTHAFYFKANDGKDGAVAGDDTTPTSPTNAKVSGPVTGSDEEESELELSTEDWSYLIFLIIIIVIIVILVLTFALARRRPKTYNPPPTQPEPMEDDDFVIEEEEDWEEEWDEE
jgi:hypothetical protein